MQNQSEIDDLIQSIADLIATLKSCGDDNWAPKLQENESGHLQDGVNNIVGMYGGMGSLNDYLVARVNGFSGTDEEAETINSTLKNQRSIVYDRARELERMLK